MDAKLFKRAGSSEWTATADGNRRRVLLHTGELMLVEFAFEKGGIGVPGMPCRMMFMRSSSVVALRNCPLKRFTPVTPSPFGP